MAEPGAVAPFRFSHALALPHLAANWGHLRCNRSSSPEAPVDHRRKRKYASHHRSCALGRSIGSVRRGTSDGTQYSTTADSSGVYTITDIPAGTYLLTAKVESESACLFYDVEPVSRSVTIPPNAGDQNFFIVSVHVTDPAITGVILDASGVGIADVVVSTPGLPSVTTDASGRFQWWPVGCDRTYWVTPHKPGYTFEPASVALTTPIEGNLRFVGRSQRQATFLPLILRPQAAQN
jgi:hypothetical protein